MNSFHSVSFHFVSLPVFKCEKVNATAEEMTIYYYFLLQKHKYIVFHSEMKFGTTVLRWARECDEVRVTICCVAFASHLTHTVQDPLVSSVNAMRWWDYRSKTRGQRRTVIRNRRVTWIQLNLMNFHICIFVIWERDGDKTQWMTLCWCCCCRSTKRMSGDDHSAVNKLK